MNPFSSMYITKFKGNIVVEANNLFDAVIKKLDLDLLWAELMDLVQLLLKLFPVTIVLTFIQEKIDQFLSFFAPHIKKC